MQFRKLDYRETWPFNNTEPIGGNYVPINTAAFIRDKKAQVNKKTNMNGKQTNMNGKQTIMPNK